MRFRNTKSVHPWYRSTIGVNTRASSVMIFNVYGVEEAVDVVRLYAALIVDGITSGCSELNVARTLSGGMKPDVAQPPAHPPTQRPHTRAP
jgi:hypothetical protein